jgi:hypothetical protein
MTHKGPLRRRRATNRDRWLADALERFVLLGGIETPENRIAVTLFLADRFEMGYTIGRAAEEAVERYLDGEFERVRR